MRLPWMKHCQLYLATLVDSSRRSELLCKWSDRSHCSSIIMSLQINTVPYTFIFSWNFILVPFLALLTNVLCIVPHIIWNLFIFTSMSLSSHKLHRTLGNWNEVPVLQPDCLRLFGTYRIMSSEGHNFWFLGWYSKIQKLWYFIFYKLWVKLCKVRAIIV